MPDVSPLASFLPRNSAVIRVRIAKVRGSSPREAGTAMFVAEGETCGTIGGGQLEYMAIDQARALLRSGRDAGRMDVPLGPEIGQCCGGRVEIALERMDAAARNAALAQERSEREAWPHVLILGAGHVGRELAHCLDRLPVHAALIDARAEELDRCTARIRRHQTPLPEAAIRAAPPGSAFVVLTHDHALDFLLAAEALGRGDAAYVGLIGSSTKRARFEAFCREQGTGLSPDRLVCPIGAAGGADKRPEIIAAFTASEVLAALTTTHAASGRRQDRMQT